MSFKLMKFYINLSILFLHSCYNNCAVTTVTASKVLQMHEWEDKIPDSAADFGHEQVFAYLDRSPRDRRL